MIAYKERLDWSFYPLSRPPPAQAGASNGSNALALSAIVGELSPQTSAPNKKLLAAYFAGRAEAPACQGPARRG